MNLDTAIIFTQSMQELADFYRQGLGYGGRDTTSPGHMGFRLENGVYLGFDQVETDYQVSGVSLCFGVSGPDAAAGCFVAAGTAVRYGRKVLPNGDVLASYPDPDGDIFGLVERQ